MADRATRLRSPAYAKALNANRRRGFHPLEVEVLYSEDWRPAYTRAVLERKVFAVDGGAARPYCAQWLREVGVPMIAVKPSEYLPGVFDWACVTGVSVCIVDGIGALGDWQETEGVITRWGLIYQLAGEVARFAAQVELLSQDGERTDVHTLAYSNRSGGAWPSWWSDEIGEAIERRALTWFAVAGRRAAT